MSRYTGPIVKKSRRYNAVLFSNGKSKENAFKKRKYAPGQHGRGGFKTLSEYGKQLQEKQKARFLFGLTEKQFKKYYTKAAKLKGITGKEILRLLELRLDNVVFRAGLAATRQQARQIVNHGHLELNGKRIDIPSIEVSVGDVITVRARSQKSPLFSETKNTKKPTHAKWLDVDYGKLTVKVAALPEDDDLEQIIDAQLIVEFYSK
jgi:small subunit ribosomal protein S4